MEVNFDDDEPEVVANMLRFLYGKGYDDGNNTTTFGVSETYTSTPSKAVRTYTSSAPSAPVLTTARGQDSIGPPLMNAKMYAIGKKYDIQALKVVAQMKYRAVLPDMWKSTSFIASLKLLYEEATDTDHAMKDIAIQLAGQHARELLGIEEFVKLCKENGEITVDVMNA